MKLPPEMDVSTLKSNSNKLQLGGQCKLKILCEQERDKARVIKILVRW